MDQDKLVGRVRNLIMQNWYKVKSDQQKSKHSTNFQTVYTSAPTVQGTKCDCGTNLNGSFHVYASTNGTDSNVGYPDNLNRPFLTAGVAKADLPGK